MRLVDQSARVQPRCSAALALLVVVAALADDVAPGRAAPPRAPARVGPDPGRRRADVRRADPCSSSASGSSSLPISLLVTLLQALVLHATSVLGVQTGGESGGLLVFFVLAHRHGADAARPRARPGGDGAGARRDRRRPADRALARVPAGSRQRRGRCSARSLIAAVVVSLLASSIFLIPIAIWLAGRWALIVPGDRARRASRRSPRCGGAAGSCGRAGSRSRR